MRDLIGALGLYEKKALRYQVDNETIAKYQENVQKVSQSYILLAET